MDTNSLHNIINNYKNKKTNEDLSNITKKNYIKMLTDMSNENENIIEFLVNNENDNDAINEKFNFIKKQGWLQSNNKKINQGRSLNYLVFLNQLVNNVDYNFSKRTKDKLTKHIKEISVKNRELKDDKSSFDELKIVWTNYCQKVDEMNKLPISKKNINEILLFNLYKHYPIRDDFGEIRLVDKDLDENVNENFYNFYSNILHLRKYKTHKKYGDKKFLLNKYLESLINIQLELGKEYLICNDDNTLIKNGKLNKFLTRTSNKYFEKPLTINDIRHSVITHHNQYSSIKTRRNLADIMLHSIETATFQYNLHQLS